MKGSNLERLVMMICISVQVWSAPAEYNTIRVGCSVHDGDQAYFVLIQTVRP